MVTSELCALIASSMQALCKHDQDAAAHAKLQQQLDDAQASFAAESKLAQETLSTFEQRAEDARCARHALEVKSAGAASLSLQALACLSFAAHRKGQDSLR